MNELPFGTRYCGYVNYTSFQPGFEEISFAVEAVLPGVVTLRESQRLSVLSQVNTHPVAGAAGAIRTDGKTGYASLGSFDFPDPDTFSIGLFVKPRLIADGLIMVSRHVVKGSNLLTFEFGPEGYALFM